MSKKKAGSSPRVASSSIGEELVSPAAGAGVAAAPRTQLCLLPSFGLTVGGKPVRLPVRSQRLIAMLALANRPLSRSVLAARLWPDVLDARANANLRTTLWSLSRHAPSTIRVDGGSLQLDPAVGLDLTAALRLARAIVERRHRDDRKAPGAADGYDESWLEHDLLSSWTDDWVATERERFRQLRLHALDELCVLHARAGRYARAITAGLASVAGEPTRESAHRALVTAHLLEGNRMAAIRQYHAYLALARDEMGIGPSDHLQRLFEQALVDPYACSPPSDNRSPSSHAEGAMKHPVTDRSPAAMA